MKKKRLSPAKAKQMLKDNSAQGRPLTTKQKKLFGAIAGGAKPYKKRSVHISKKELVEEHKELVKTLKSGSKKQLAKEASKQGEELKEYKKKRDPGTFGTKHMSQPDVYGKAMSSATKNAKVFGSPTAPKGNYPSSTQLGWGKATAKLKRGMKGHKR